LPKPFTEEFQKQAGKDRERRFWQPTQHPVGISSNGFWKQKMDYIHDNPCRKGMVLHPEDWRFSSARFWLTGESSDVQLLDVGWECIGDLRSSLGGVEDPRRAGWEEGEEARIRLTALRALFFLFDLQSAPCHAE